MPEEETVLKPSFAISLRFAYFFHKMPGLICRSSNESYHLLGPSWCTYSYGNLYYCKKKKKKKKKRRKAEPDLQ